MYGCYINQINYSLHQTIVGFLHTAFRVIDLDGVAMVQTFTGNLSWEHVCLRKCSQRAVVVFYIHKFLVNNAIIQSFFCNDTNFQRKLEWECVFTEKFPASGILHPHRGTLPHSMKFPSRLLQIQSSIRTEGALTILVRHCFRSGGTDFYNCHLESCILLNQNHITVYCSMD